VPSLYIYFLNNWSHCPLVFSPNVIICSVTGKIQDTTFYSKTDGEQDVEKGKTFLKIYITITIYILNKTLTVYFYNFKCSHVFH